MKLFNKYIILLISFILFSALLACDSPEIHVKVDDRLIPYPFYGKIKQIDESEYLIYYSQFTSGLIVYDIEREIINNDILYENYYLKNGHFQTFTLSEDYRLFMTPKGISDIIEFNIYGIKNHHYWSKERSFNHFSNYRNHPIFYKNEIFQTSIDSLKNRDKGYLIEKITDIKNKSTRQIKIHYPKNNSDLPIAGMFPSKIRVGQSIIYNFPNYSAFLIYNLNDQSIEEKELFLEKELNVSKEILDDDYVSEIDFYKNSDLIRKVVYNKITKEFMLVLKRNGFKQYTIVKLDENYRQIGEEQHLSTSCYWESLIPNKNSFIAIDNVKSLEMEGFIFKDVNTFTL
ncbi:hypothetical protein [Marivirga sp.]|uniref:hypothetical protein n=1 Tax=Marivirga sp. TaxID=2018662 RepID=UPI003DA6E1C7